jgi:hypothetical protein
MRSSGFRRGRQAAGRLTLIRARTGLNPLLLLFPVIGGMTYAYLANAAELIGQSGVAVALLSVLAVLCGFSIVLRPTADRLELFRVFSFYYLVTFCIGPLFEPAISLYRYDDPKPALLERASALALFAYVCIAVGYHLPFYRRAPKVVLARHDEYDVTRATAASLLLFGVGVVSFLAMFVLAGGAAVILQGEGEVHRTEFSFGLGWYYWASLFMIPAGAAYFAAQASRRRRFPWIHGWPLASAFALLLLLQGRHRAIGPMLVMFFVSHYMVHRIRLPRMALYAVVGIALAIVMGVARSTYWRGTFAANPIGFSRSVLQDFPERVADLLSGDIGRIDEVMIVIDHVPDRMPYDYGSSLTIPLNPFRRLIWGVGSEAQPIGTRLYDISRPDMRRAKTRTGFLPSIVGEMRANFPAIFCLLPFLLYGVLLRSIYQRLIMQNADFLSVAAYAVLTFHFCNMAFGTIGQSLFEIAVVFAPILLIRAVARRRVRRVAQGGIADAASPAPSQTPGLG